MGESKLKHFKVILQSVDRIQTELDDLKKWIDSQIFEDKMLSERNCNPRRNRNRNRRKNSAVLSKNKPNLDENELPDDDVAVKHEIDEEDYEDNTDYDQEMSNSYPSTSTSTKAKKYKRSYSSQNKQYQEPGEIDDDDEDPDYNYNYDDDDDEVSNLKRKSARVSHNWTLLKTVSIIEEFDEMDDWSVEFTRHLKTGKSVCYYCKEGGRICPAKLKFVYQSEQFGIEIYDNNIEHEHSEKKEKELKRKTNASSQSQMNIDEETRSTPKSRANKRSFVWDHFTKTEINDKIKVVCNICKIGYAFAAGGGTGNFILHLKNRHPDLIPIE